METIGVHGLGVNENTQAAVDQGDGLSAVGTFRSSRFCVDLDAPITDGLNT